MPYNPQNPMIVQGDKSILLEVDNPGYEEARDILNRFAELVKSPEHIHTYRITNLSLWNAAASGMKPDDIISSLIRLGKYDLPENIGVDIRDYISRYGRIKLIRKDDGSLVLVSEDPILMSEIWNHKIAKPYLISKVDDTTIKIDPSKRGHIKKALTEIGFPAQDLAGYLMGDFLQLDLLSVSKKGMPFSLRDYQVDSIHAFYDEGSTYGGCGTIVLPCGAGKTLVGIGALTQLKCNTLIITTGITAARQWITEILDKTTLSQDEVGEYSGEIKQIRPVTVTTYQILTYRQDKINEEFPHFSLFDSSNWGLIIYDEVHMLPAPVFRITAEIQAKRRLGLTATLVREDGHEEDVFSLIGPKKYDAPWKDLEKKGWIAQASCTEIRVAMPDDLRMLYAMSDDRSKYRISAENPKKYELVQNIVAHHRKNNDKILVIGMYIEQLERIARALDAPLLKGQTANIKRDQMYQKFRDGSLDILVLSKVGNFAIDLPDANVAIQVSGTFGSRQEEAQRLGRILRPKKDCGVAHFYSIVTKDSKDQDFSANRQMFLTEQGYRYRIMDSFYPCVEPVL
jgi:DNA excision repair protein ERCC-3